MKSNFYRFYLSLDLPRKLHGLARMENGTHIYANQLLDLQVSSNKSNAGELFDEMPYLNVVSATVLIRQFCRQHRYKEAVGLFSRMFLLNIKPSEFTFGTLIHSSTEMQNLCLGKQFHACAIKMGLYSIVFVGSAMLNFYVKLSVIDEAWKAFEDIENPNVVSYTTLVHGYLKKGSIENAVKCFKEMPERNVVSWNAMISGCSQMGFNEESVNLFVEMMRDGFMPNQSTLPSVISAASNIAAIGMGRSFHAIAIKSLCEFDVFVGNSLVSFYAKCGCMDDGLLVFVELPDRNIVSWNAVICGFAQNGRGDDAVSFFEKMRESGLRPNSVTILGLLWACAHAGLVDRGYYYFNQLRVQNPNLLKPEHYACMVDLLSRGGRLKEAERFLHELPFDPGIGFWKSLLGGCHVHLNMELGYLVTKKILALDPGDVSSYVMLSNAYSAAGRWKDVSIMRKEMTDKGLNRVSGCSWIEVRSKVHVFVTSDRNHCQKDEIYVFLNFVTEQLRDIEACRLSVEC